MMTETNEHEPKVIVNPKAVKIADESSVVERVVEKQVNKVKEKNWNKQELEPFSDLMNSMAKAEKQKWNLCKYKKV